MQAYRWACIATRSSDEYFPPLDTVTNALTDARCSSVLLVLQWDGMLDCYRTTQLLLLCTAAACTIRRTGGPSGQLPQGGGRLY